MVCLYLHWCVFFQESLDRRGKVVCALPPSCGAPCFNCTLLWESITVETNGAGWITVHTLCGSLSVGWNTVDAIPLCNENIAEQMNYDCL